MRPAIKLSKPLQGVDVTKVNQIPVSRPNCCSTDRNPSLQESREKNNKNNKASRFPAKRQHLHLRGFFPKGWV